MNKFIPTMIPLYPQLLILVLLAISSTRVFYIRKTRLDSLVLFIPFSVLILFIESIAWSFSATEVLLAVILLIASIINYKSFFRFCNHLLIDSYSSIFTIFSTLLLILSIGAGIYIISNKPVYLDSSKLQVKTETIFYSGTLSSGFSDSDEFFQTKNLQLTIYSPDTNQGNYQNDYAVLFVPDKRANFSSYDPFLKLLAKSGYKVYAGDFGFSTVPSKSKINIDFIRQIELNLKSKNDGARYFTTDENKYYLDIYAKEFEMLSLIADKNEPVSKKFMIIADEGPALAASRTTKTARPVKMFHNISLISEYKTPGFGFIQQSDPLLAKFKYKLNKDKTGYTPSYVVMRVKAAVEKFEKDEAEFVNEELK